MAEEHDLIVIGGGPAGTSLSILMAEAGFSVLLLEKGRYPLQKVCGEYLSREALPYLDRLSIPYASLNPPSIDQLRVTCAKGPTLQCALPLGGVGLSRNELDRMMAERVREKGGTVKEGSKVRSISPTERGFSVQTRDSEYKAHTVVEAHGKDKGPAIHGPERPRKKKGTKGLRKWVGIKHRVEGPLPRGRIELHTFPGGYAGLSRIEGENKGCLSYLIDASILQERGRGAVERQRMEENPHLAGWLRTLHFPEHPVGISELAFGRGSSHEEGIWSTGDAAVSIPPLAGNGMSMAIEGSFFLAPELIGLLQGKLDKEEAVRRYHKASQRHFGTRMRIGKALQGFFSKEARMALLIKGFKPFPGLTKSLIAKTHGPHP